MLLKIVQVGDSGLRNQASKLTVAQLKRPQTQQLIDLMITTLRDRPGVGLAAPQVGESLQIIVVEDTKEYQKKIPKKLLTAQKRQPVELMVLINPVVTILDEKTDYFFEGCLSIDGYRAIVPRARKIRLSGLDRDGRAVSPLEAEGWLARILQHEVDHLNGDLYVDTMYTKSFMTENHFAKTWAQASPTQLTHYVEKFRRAHDTYTS